MPMGLAGAAGVGYLKQNSPQGPLCIALAEWYIGKTLFMVVGAMLRPLRTLCVVTKKPALGGLEEAQALRRLSDAQNDTSNLVSNQGLEPRA